MEIKKPKKFLVRRDTAKKFWKNNGSSAQEISEKFKVSLSTGYRWISEWESESNA